MMMKMTMMMKKRKKRKRQMPRLRTKRWKWKKVSFGLSVKSHSDLYIHYFIMALTEQYPSSNPD